MRHPAPRSALVLLLALGCAGTHAAADAHARAALASARAALARALLARRATALHAVGEHERAEEDLERARNTVP